MKKKAARTLRHTAAGLVWRALAIAVLFLVVHLLGWRNDTCILAGALPAGATAKWAGVRGLLYLGLYFGSVVGGPILLIAATLLLVLHLARRRLALPPADSSVAEAGSPTTAAQ